MNPQKLHLMNKFKRTFLLVLLALGLIMENAEALEKCTTRTLHGTYSFSTMGNITTDGINTPIALSGYIYFDGKGNGATEFLGSTSSTTLPVTPDSFIYSQPTGDLNSCIFDYDLNTSNNGINFTSVSIFASKDAKLIHGISTHKGVNYAFEAQRVSLNNLISTSPLPGTGLNPNEPLN